MRFIHKSAKVVTKIGYRYIRKFIAESMFNLYQSINKKDEKEEAGVIGHDRFYQGRTSRSSVRRKKKITKRAHSIAEFSSTTLAAANKRAEFEKRSQSSEQRDDKDGLYSPQRSESIARVLFSRGPRSSSLQRHEYSALKSDGGTERYRLEKQVRDGAFTVCRHHLATSDRYELRSHLGDIGSRADKHWFIVQDIALGAERLLSMVPLPSLCPIIPSPSSRDTVLALFRSLQHPYIHPVLDIEFWEAGVALVSPLNEAGSLRDLIYGCVWYEDCGKKYTGRGEALPLWQVQRLGRQILEALLFVRERDFPPFYHLHAGNVIVQNGVARLAGLENPLLGLLPRPPSALGTHAFGHLLFEMTVGYELPSPPSPAHLQLQLERAPRVADVLKMIFESTRKISLEEVLCCDLFRGVELRELRGANGVQSRSPPEVLELLDHVKCSVPPVSMRRDDVVVVVESRQLEDIEEESENESIDVSR